MEEELQTSCATLFMRLRGLWVKLAAKITNISIVLFCILWLSKHSYD